MLLVVQEFFVSTILYLYECTRVKSIVLYTEIKGINTGVWQTGLEKISFENIEHIMSSTLQFQQSLLSHVRTTDSSRQQTTSQFQNVPRILLLDTQSPSLTLPAQVV